LPDEPEFGAPRVREFEVLPDLELEVLPEREFVVDPERELEELPERELDVDPRDPEVLPEREPDAVPERELVWLQDTIDDTNTIMIKLIVIFLNIFLTPLYLFSARRWK
jgi:hypothetical protein